MPTTTDIFTVKDILRAVSNALQTPVIVILIVIIICSVALLGWLVAELFSERRHLKLKLPKLLDELRAEGADVQALISGSGLLRSQKEALLELTRHPQFNDMMREALAVRLIEQEQEKYDRVVKLSELVVRLGPIFGLLGTLIPLGPGIIALGQGDTYTLSTSLLTAFDTTVAGLISAAVATVVSSVRRSWYREYMSILEVISECILEIEKEEVPVK